MNRFLHLEREEELLVKSFTSYILASIYIIKSRHQKVLKHKVATADLRKLLAVK